MEIVVKLMMKVCLITTLLVSTCKGEMCTSEFSLSPPLRIESTETLHVHQRNDRTVTITYDSHVLPAEKDVIVLLERMNSVTVTSLHNNTCDPCEMCDYCAYDSSLDNTYGTGGAFHNFLCADGSNCKGCDLVQSYAPEACDMDISVYELLNANSAFLEWSKPFKEACPQKCDEQRDCVLKCSHLQHTVNLYIRLDDSPGETFYQLYQNDTKKILAQGGYYTAADANRIIHVTSCVSAGCYALALVDSGYNGITGGRYRVNVDGADVIDQTHEGSTFNFSVTKTFCTDPAPRVTTSDVTSAPPPTPPPTLTSPPPSTSPPPPDSQQLYNLSFSFVASGSIADYDTTRINALRSKCSQSTGIPVTNISIHVTAASVNLVTSFRVRGTTEAKRLESTLVVSTAAQATLGALFGNELTPETMASSVSFEQLESYCTCKPEWTYPCKDGIVRKGCAQNSCGDYNSLYCPATDETCTPDPILHNSQDEAFQDTRDGEFIFWCSPSCLDDPNGEIQREGWGSTATDACVNIIEGLRASHSKTLEETCLTDLSEGNGILLQHYCPVTCENASPLCAATSPPPAVGALVSLTPPPPAITSPLAPTKPPPSPMPDNDDNTGHGSDMALLVVAIVLGVLVLLGAIAIIARKYMTVEVVDVEVNKPNASVNGPEIPSSVTNVELSNQASERAAAIAEVRSTHIVPTIEAKHSPVPLVTSGVLPLKPPSGPFEPPSGRGPSRGQSSVNQMFVPSRRSSPRRSRSSSPRRTGI